MKTLNIPPFNQYEIRYLGTANRYQAPCVYVSTPRVKDLLVITANEALLLLGNIPQDEAEAIAGHVRPYLGQDG